VISAGMHLRCAFTLAVSLSTAACGSASTTTSGPGGEAGVSCGTRDGMRGKTSRTTTVKGTARTYIVYLPEGGNPATPVPLVYVFHGAAMDAQEMFDITQYSAIADREGIAIAFLDGQNTNSSTGLTSADPWNVTDGPQVCGLGNLVNNPTTGVDFDLMDQVKADVEQDQCLDAAHVFASGFSMGGYMSHHVGCDRTDVRAVAPSSGATMSDLSSCKTGHVPIIIFHGVADPLISDGCDDPNATPYGSFPASATLWAKKNGCASTYKTIPEEGDGGGQGQCYLYDGCPADGQVELCTFNGMGHCYAGGSSTSGMFSCSTYPSATDLQWAFFKTYAW
jgi:polyhydroxybutyrate depolymerase